MAKIWHLCEVFNFYPILNYYKIRTRTNFENPNIFRNYPVQCEHSLSFNCEQLQAETIRLDDGFTSSTQHRSP